MGGGSEYMPFTGAFANSYTDYTYRFQGGKSGNFKVVNFKASNSNEIYGSSNTVQPPAVRVYVWIREQ